MEDGPLPPLGMQKSLACQECSREMADYRRRVAHPIKVHFCRTRLNLGGGLFVIPAGVGRAVCILQFPTTLPSPWWGSAPASFAPPPWSSLLLMGSRLSKARWQIALRGVPDWLLPHPPAVLAVLFCINSSHHSLNRCALVSTCLLALGTNGGTKNAVGNQSENVFHLDGCCSLTASYPFTKQPSNSPQNNWLPGMGYGTSIEVNRKEFDLGKESRKSAMGKDTCRVGWHLKDRRGRR